MGSKKKDDTIADQINSILKPKELIEERDENEARLEDFNEHEEIHQLSDIRKQTAKHLSEIDSKYKGKVVSRKELGLEAEKEISENDDNLLSESEEENDSVEDSDEDELEEEQSDEENASGSESNESDEDFDDDGFDISQFSTNNKQNATSYGNENEQDKTVLLDKKSINEEVKKGKCVQNQLSIWEKLLEVRIKAQKMLITANSFPDYDSFIELTEIEDSPFVEKIEDACDGVYNLLDNLLVLQSTLIEKFTESKDILKGVKRKNSNKTNGSLLMKKSRLAEYAEKIEDNYNSYSNFRNQVLQKWHDRTKNLKDTKNPITNLNILTKIENALLNKNEVIRKSQIYRGDYDIYGVENPKASENSTGEIELTEIYDDSDFYHQLLRELIEFKSNAGDSQAEITQKFIELQKVRSKMKKRVETRASKGRKIRYNVHNKLVNFMPPRDNSEWTDEAKTELFNSLFGQASKIEIENTS